MVRMTLLAVIVAACLAAAPAAQAAVVPLDVQSTAATAVGQVQGVTGQVVTTARSVTPAAPPPSGPVGGVTDAAGAVMDGAVEGGSGAGGAVGGGSGSGALGRGSGPGGALGGGGPTLPGAGTPSAAERPAEPATDRNPSATPVIADGQRSSRPGQRARSASFRHEAWPGSHLAGGVPSDPARGAPIPTGATPSEPGAASSAGQRQGAQQHPAAPDRQSPSTFGGAPASAPAAGLALGGLALLAAAVCLAGPRLRRRLFIAPTGLRPVVFVALLERPG